MYLLLASVIIFCVNMGEGGRRFSTSDEPVFVPLEEKQGSYTAIVYDEKNQERVLDFSFFGHTSVGGIRKETDDSFTRLELSEIKEIRIVNPSFQSKRYSDKEFALVTVVTKKGIEIKDLLVPKNVVICGIGRDTGNKKAWWLRKVDKIIIEGELSFDKKLFMKKKPIAPEQLKQFKEYEKLQEKEKSASLVNAFMKIIDSFIDFVKTLFKKILKLIGF